MDFKSCFTYIIALQLLGSVASATTIDVIMTFSYPLEHTIATLPQKIEDQTDLAGTFITSDGLERAFIYKPLQHKFGPPLSPAFANGAPTEGHGVNFLRHIVGDYVDETTGRYHGFLMTHPNCTPTPTPSPTPTPTPTPGDAIASAPPTTLAEETDSDLFFEDEPEPDAGLPRCPLVFTPLDIANALDTIPLGINNLGDIVGTATFGDGSQPAFLTVKQVTTKFVVPGAAATFAYQVNDSGQIVGYYVDANGISHGYMRDSAGALTFPIDVPGATETFLLGNNASNWVVGRYTDTAGVTHGLFYVTPDDIFTYDYPGATATSLTGINKNSLICGYYTDMAGVSHGFVARVNVTASGKPNMNTRTVPVKPIYALPQIPGISVPVL